MTVNDDPGRVVSEWLHEHSAHRVPAHLDAVLRTTSTRRQRPAWSIPERWLPMGISTRAGTLAPLRLGRALLVVLLVVALVALTIVAVGSRPNRVPPPFGPARNGELIVSADGDILRIDPASGETTPLIAGPTFDFGPDFSRDGTRFLFLRGAPANCGKPDCGLILASANADGTGIRELTPGVPSLDWADWSPDGSQIALLAAAPNGTGHELDIVSADGSSMRTVALGLPVLDVSWLPPAGQELVFRGDWQADAAADRGIFAVRPDGSGLRRLPTRGIGPERDYRGVSVSPDGTLLTYQDTAANAFRVHIVDLRSGADHVPPHPADTGQLGAGFSPDGRKLVYLRWETDGQFRVVVAPVDGSSTGIELGPPAPFGPDGPTINNYGFTPDGTAVLANYDAEKVARLLPIDGSAGTILVHGELALPAYQRLAP